MVFVHSRITSEDDVVLNSVILWIRSNAKCILAVQEITEDGKKHIHVMSEYAKTVSTFGQKFRDAFPKLKGNGSHSCKEFEKSYDHNLRYLCKGQIAGKKSDAVILFSSLEKSVTDDAHERFWEEQEKFVTENGLKSDTNTKKKNTIPFVEKVIYALPTGTAEHYSYFQSIYHPTDNDCIQLEKYKTIIVETTLATMGKLSKVLDDNILTRMINGVLLKCVTDYGQPEQKQAMFKRLHNRIGHNLI